MELADLVRPFRRMIRSPVVHFLAIGAALFAIAEARRASVPETPRLSLPPWRVERIAEDWRRTTGRAPDDAELRILVRAETDREILVREARRAGLHRSDPVILRRLLQNMRFVRSEETDGAALLDEAFAIGMDETDEVVRRRLVHLMENRLRSVDAETIREQDLAVHLAANPGEFMRPARVAFTHAYLSAERGAGEIAALEAKLRRRGAPTQDEALPGERFPLGETFGLSTEREIAKILGGGTARTVLEAALGEWTGPIRSSFGSHFVWIHDREEARPHSLDEVRERVRLALLAEREEEALGRRLTKLRERYGVEPGG